jgi:hypothetical protein
MKCFTVQGTEPHALPGPCVAIASWSDAIPFGRVAGYAAPIRRADQGAAGTQNPRNAKTRHKGGPETSGRGPGKLLT